MNSENAGMKKTSPPPLRHWPKPRPADEVKIYPRLLKEYLYVFEQRTDLGTEKYSWKPVHDPIPASVYKSEAASFQTCVFSLLVISRCCRWIKTFDDCGYGEITCKARFLIVADATKDFSDFHGIRGYWCWWDMSRISRAMITNVCDGLLPRSKRRVLGNCLIAPLSIWMTMDAFIGVQQQWLIRLSMDFEKEIGNITCTCTMRLEKDCTSLWYLSVRVVRTRTVYRQMHLNNSPLDDNGTIISKIPEHRQLSPW